MKTHRMGLYALLVLAGLAMVGCTNGPALRLGLTFKQGPEFSIDFGLTPQVTNSVPGEAGQ